MIAMYIAFNSNSFILYKTMLHLLLKNMHGLGWQENINRSTCTRVHMRTTRKPMIVEYVEGVSIFASIIGHVVFPVLTVTPSARLGICPHHLPHSPMTCKEFNEGQFLPSRALCPTICQAWWWKPLLGKYFWWRHHGNHILLIST